MYCNGFVIRYRQKDVTMFYNKTYGFLKAPLAKEWIGIFHSRKSAQKCIDNQIALPLRVSCSIISKSSIGKNCLMPLAMFLGTDMYKQLMLKKHENGLPKKVKAVAKAFVSKESYPPQMILPYLGDYERDYDGDLIWMGDDRYQNFQQHGTICANCGLEGTYFRKQRTPGPRNREYCRYHFNLYGQDSQGQAVMLTKDHIIPKAKGGADALYNYQPLCVTCNGQKVDNLPTRETLLAMPRNAKEQELLLKAFDELIALEELNKSTIPDEEVSEEIWQ